MFKKNTKKQNYSELYLKQYNQILRSIAKKIADCCVVKGRRKKKDLYVSVGVMDVANAFDIIFVYGRDKWHDWMQNLSADFHNIADKFTGKVELDFCQWISTDRCIFIISSDHQDEPTKILKQIEDYVVSYGCKIDLNPIHISAVFGFSSLDCNNFPNNVSEKDKDLQEDVKAMLDKAFIDSNDLVADYRVKVKHSFTTKGRVEAKERMVLMNLVRYAYYNGGLHLAYQPIKSTKSGKIAFYECLLRVKDEHGEIRSIGPFIPLLETANLVSSVDIIAFNKAIDELKNHKREVLSVNVSAISLKSKDWQENALNLTSNKTIAKRLIVELTETQPIDNMDCAAAFLNKLKENGCRIAIDDFGTGYTTCNTLKHLPIDILKIDGSYIESILENKSSQVMVKSIVDMCHDLNIEVVAEFVTSEECAKYLKKLGVDYLQGHAIGEAKVQ